MGTPEFAVPVLEKINKEYGVEAVVTVPDKPKGRGLTVFPSPVKAKALELGLDILQPEKLKESEFVSKIQELSPDIILVVAFRILPKEVYSIAKIGSFNIHGSLLPRWRGAAPINHAIINGDHETGLTTFLLQDKVDTGNILLYDKTPIDGNMTAGELHDQLMQMAPELAVKTIELLKTGNYTVESQNENLATPAPKIFREDCLIDFSKDSRAVHNFIRGLSPHPGAHTYINGKYHKILRSIIVPNTNIDMGHYLIDDGKLYGGCKTDAIKILEIQPENKKAMPVADFLRGWRGESNGKFGDND